MIVGLDFDGTLVSHRYPHVGKDIGAWPWLHKATDAGAEFVLVTMRDGQEIREAVQLCMGKGLALLGINHNPTQKQWTQSPKPYCHIYVDDAALGVPLVQLPDEQRPCVDWDVAGPMLLDAVRKHRGRP